MIEGLCGVRHWGIRFGLGMVLALGAAFADAAQPVPSRRPAPPSTHIQASAHQDAPAAKITVPMVLGLKLAESPGRARFMVEFSDPVDARVFTLTNPNRVVIDMPDVQWRIQDPARPSGKGTVKSYSYGQFRKGNSRLIVDLNGPAKVGTPELLQPEGGQGFRLQFDLTPTNAAEFVAHAGWPSDLQPGLQTAAATGSTSALRTASASAKPIIILDAGHGGVDPGTHGQSGIVEKDLVLSVTRALRKTLEATGRYRVQLTRDSDVFIPLRERVNIARAAHADLFVSLHADSNDHREIRGASVYTLSEDASDREAAKLADKENMSDLIGGVALTGQNNPVANILIDLTQRDTMNRSLRFAETVLGALPAVTSIQPASPHRSAGFAVLKAPDVPSVLIELGYLTNGKDESEMATEAWRNRVSQAISEAIDAHFSTGTRLLLRQASNP
ncbi:MAG TPA: N-acetylmuramoyl-L-alanine amidase [Micropepsaceae bacterium]|jgi:N-acetylmuramoyl-L-alanine amidase|nr:N-acetylmuramoyl-L-alanine amidase [Micropepsaceae bacterium]